MKHTILKILVVSLIAIFSSNSYAAKLYKWVDANGNISYQDQPPPTNGTLLSEKEVASNADPVDEDVLPEIVVYTVAECELCLRLVTVLKQNKVPHIELPLEDDRGAQNRILEKASSIIAPTIFIGEDILQGGNEENLLAELRSAGFEIEDPAEVKTGNRLKQDQIK